MPKAMAKPSASAGMPHTLMPLSASRFRPRSLRARARFELRRGRSGAGKKKARPRPGPDRGHAARAAQVLPRTATQNGVFPGSSQPLTSSRSRSITATLPGPVTAT